MLTRRLLLSLGASSLGSCLPSAPTSLLEGSFEVLGKTKAPHYGRLVDLFDVKIALRNPTDSPVELACVKTNSLSDYLQGRNPGKIIHGVERFTKGKWSGCGQGLFGIPTEPLSLAPGKDLTFICTIAWRLVEVPGRFRIFIGHSQGWSWSSPHVLYSPEFEIPA